MSVLLTSDPVQAGTQAAKAKGRERLRKHHMCLGPSNLSLSRGQCSYLSRRKRNGREQEGTNRQVWRHHLISIFLLSWTCPGCLETRGWGQCLDWPSGLAPNFWPKGPSSPVKWGSPEPGFMSASLPQRLGWAGPETTALTPESHLCHSLRGLCSYHLNYRVSDNLKPASSSQSWAPWALPFAWCEQSVVVCPLCQKFTARPRVGAPLKHSWTGFVC